MRPSPGMNDNERALELQRRILEAESCCYESRLVEQLVEDLHNILAFRDQGRLVQLPADICTHEKAMPK